MSDMLDRKLLEKGLISLLCKTEIITYDIAWNDAIRHVLMDLKTGMYAPSPQDNTRQQEGLVPVAEALDLGIKWMEWWLGNQECDCDEYHFCGRNERRRELDQMRFARELLNTRTPSPPTKQEPPHDHT